MVQYLSNQAMLRLLRYLDPRRSLASAIGWLVFALSIGLVLTASAWVGDIVRDSLLDQQGRQLDATAEHIAAELNLNLTLRLQSVRALAATLGTELLDEDHAMLQRALENLQRAYPELETIVVANPQGRLLAATPGAADGVSMADRAWFALGLEGSKIGVVRTPPAATMAAAPGTDGSSSTYVDLFAPATDARGKTVGVVGTQLRRSWLLDLASGLRQELQASTGAEAIVLNADGTVLIGPPGIIGKQWDAARESADAATPFAAFDARGDRGRRSSRVELMADGSRFVVARAAPAASDALHALGWRVMVLQPLQDATQRARVLQGRIAAVLLGLGLVAAVLGALLARRITRGLDAIARSADAVRAGSAREITVPRGLNEAARLGRALDELLTTLQRERSALQSLNAELDQRVAARTREVERLAGQERHAAIVRERLRIARDLHDTLAHSMMAMLTEIRLLKRLSTADPGAMAEELARAEEAAHHGLQEARAAIAQMRFNPVRDAGLAAALRDLVKLFVERSGIPVDYASDVPAGAFADERAETLFRIAEEALNNVQRHANATRAAISLQASADGRELRLTISDNGVGFDTGAPHPGHYGLAGLREQSQLIGAVLDIRSAPQQGTIICVMLALAPGLDA